MFSGPACVKGGAVRMTCLRWWLCVRPCLVCVCVCDPGSLTCVCARATLDLLRVCVCACAKESHSENIANSLIFYCRYTSKRFHFSIFERQFLHLTFNTASAFVYLTKKHIKRKCDLSIGWIRILTSSRKTDGEVECYDVLIFSFVKTSGCIFSHVKTKAEKYCRLNAYIRREFIQKIVEFLILCLHLT